MSRVLDESLAAGASGVDLDHAAIEYRRHSARMQHKTMRRGLGPGTHASSVAGGDC